MSDLREIVDLLRLMEKHLSDISQNTWKNKNKLEEIKTELENIKKNIPTSVGLNW